MIAENTQRTLITG